MPRGIKRTPSLDPESDGDTKPMLTKKPKISASKAAPRPWTADELDAVLTIALKHGASIANFEGQVPDRTGNQCMRTWLITVVPFLHKAVRDKGDKTAGKKA